MRWSFSLGTVKGTAVRIHWTFPLFLGWIVLSAYGVAGAGAAFGAGVFFLLLFLCVLLHEFGHILTARRYGVQTRDVVLLPIGGVAQMDQIPEQPRQELAVALAGPAVNLVIALALIVALGGLPQHVDVDMSNLGADLPLHLAYANLALAIFNLIPAFPMDGGRALRALLASRLGYVRGTAMAAAVGQTLAVIFGIYAIFAGHLILGLIAVFVYFAAGAEAGMVQLRGATLASLASDVMIDDFEVLGERQSVANAAESLIRTHQHEFLVLDDQRRATGVVTRDGIVEALKNRGPQALLADIMKRNVPVVSMRHHADEVLRLLQMGATAAAVLDDSGELVGMVTLDNILEFVLVQRASTGLSVGRSSIRLASA